MLVLVDTDAPRSRPLLVRVRVGRGNAAPGDGGAVETLWAGTAPAPPGARAIGLPGSFSVVPGPGGARDERVTVVIDAEFPAASAAEPAVSFRRVARFAFVPRTSMRLPVLLAVTCGARSSGCTSVPEESCTVAVRCEEQGATCGDRGTCAPVDVAPTPAGPEPPEFPRPDASGPTVVALSRQPFALARDETNVYWADFGAGGVWRVPIAGGPAAALSDSGGDVYAMAARGGELFWAPRYAGIVQSVPSGGGAPSVRVPDAPGVTSFAFDGDTVFFGSDGEPPTAGVWRAPLAGGAPVQVASGFPSVTVAVRDGHVYFGSYSAGVLARFSTAGGGTALLVSSDQGVRTLAVDDAYLYWTNQDQNAVRRTPRGGGDIETLAAGQDGAFGLALDGGEVFWTTARGGTVMRARPGEAPRAVATGQDQPTNVVIAGGFVYWTNRGGTLMRAPR